MIAYSIPSLIGSFIAISLGAVVIHKRLRDKPGRVFFFLMLSIAIWCFSEFMMQNCKNSQEALLWAKVANLGFILIPTFLVRLAFVYPKEVIKESKLVYVLPALLGALIIFTDTLFLVVPSATPELAFEYRSKELYPLLPIFFFCYLSIAIFLLLAKKLKLKFKSEKEQITHLSIGVASIIVLILASLALGQIIPFILFDSFLALAIACFFTYVVLRYQLFDLRVELFARRALITTTSFALIVAIFLALIIFSTLALQDYFTHYPHYFYLTILFVVALSLKKLDSTSTAIIELLFPSLKWKECEVNEVFLIHKEKGIVVTHVALKPKVVIDSDVAAGMLTAVQDFLGVTLKAGRKKELNVLSYGGIKLLIEHGLYCYMVIVFSGYEIEAMRTSIRKVMHEIDERYGTVLAQWDGDLNKVESLAPVIREMLV